MPVKSVPKSVVNIKLSAPYASFNSPFCGNSEVRRSYPVITPISATGALEAILWHPGMKYVIHSLSVLEPIQLVQVWWDKEGNLIHEEKLDGLLPSALPVNPLERSSIVLKDVSYMVRFHISLTENVSVTDTIKKFRYMFERRALRHRPYNPMVPPHLGLTQFPCSFDLFTKGSPRYTPVETSVDFGFMLYDLAYGDDKTESLYYDAVMKNGVIECRKKYITLSSFAPHYAEEVSVYGKEPRKGKTEMTAARSGGERCGAAESRCR